jgi:hypothetical protein
MSTTLFDFTLSSRPALAAEVHERERESRQHLLDHLPDLLQWHQEVGGCQEYARLLRGLLRAREDCNTRAITAYLGRGKWPKADVPSRHPAVQPSLERTREFPEGHLNEVWVEGIVAVLARWQDHD